jgi:hypothetical protein
MSAQVTFEVIERLIGCATGEFARLVRCAGHREAPLRNMQVLKIWRDRPGFASFACAHCEASGYVVRDGAARITREDHARLRAQADAAAELSKVERFARARALWSRRLPIAGTVAETYLRRARSYGGALPATLGFLPPRGPHGPAMIAAFGMAYETDETRPGRLQSLGIGVWAAGRLGIRVGTDGGSELGMLAPMKIPTASRITFEQALRGDRPHHHGEQP